MQADSFGDTGLIPELRGSVPQRIPSRDFRAHPWAGGLWRCSCVLKTQLHCWEVMARLRPGGFGDDRDPCGSRWPLDSGGEGCWPCKRLCDTTLWARAELRPSLIPKYRAHKSHLPVPFVLLVVCVCFPMFPLRNDNVRDGCCDKLIADWVLLIYVWQLSWALEWRIYEKE